MDTGYDPERFLIPIRSDLLCGICFCVLKNPRLCQAGEHHFCFKCISQSLCCCATCPVCRQHLTLETLQWPSRFLRNFLSDLIIKCDYINRGCYEEVKLGNLEHHAEKCQYRPISCENCHLEMNARDEDFHKRFCQLDQANIHSFGHIKMRQEEMNDDLIFIRETQRKFGEKQNAIEENQILQRQELNEVTNSCEEIHTFTNTIYDEMRGEMTGIKRRYANIYPKVKRMKVIIITYIKHYCLAKVNSARLLVADRFDKKRNDWSLRFSITRVGPFI